jgi:hypothetical protein
VLTRDERRLLRALAAAQAADEMLMDNYLYKLALGFPSRALLAEAMRALAAALANQEHWLPVGEVQQPLPAPTSPVACVHGRELHGTTLAWPGGLPTVMPATDLLGDLHHRARRATGEGQAPHSAGITQSHAS